MSENCEKCGEVICGCAQFFPSECSQERKGEIERMQKLFTTEAEISATRADMIFKLQRENESLQAELAQLREKDAATIAQQKEEITRLSQQVVDLGVIVMQSKPRKD